MTTARVRLGFFVNINSKLSTYNQLRYEFLPIRIYQKPLEETISHELLPALIFFKINLPIFQRNLEFKTKTDLIVGSLFIKKWVHCALWQTFLKLCMVEPISVTFQKTKRPKMDMSHGLIYRPDCDDIISPVRFGSILVKQLCLV